MISLEYGYIIAKDMSTLFSAVRLADIADVAIVAIIIYNIFILFKQTRSYLIFVGISLMAALYACAKIFNLYLTTLALQSFFSVLFVILVVIFQNELRRFFEFIALLGTRRVKLKTSITLPIHVSELVQASAHLAHEKIGALIVIQGKDSLDRFIQGGQLLDGVISENVLASIFDPNSAGHDGAVVINQNRITQFGAQLPLSTNFKEIGKHGTRHSAAVGLSERTDALCIIVSEEKGTISLARDGKLKTLTTAEDLEKDLGKFLRDKHLIANKNFAQDLIQKNSKLKLISALCAIGLWLTVSARTETIQKDFSLPITIKNLPENTLIEDSSPRMLTVSLQGRGEVAFSNIDASSLEISLDADNLKSGLNTVNIPTSAIKRPLNLNLVSVQPSTVYLLVKKYKLVKVPVNLKTKNLPKKLTISSTTITPSEIEFWLPEEATKPDTLDTKTIDFSSLTDSTIIETEAIMPPGAKLKKTDDSKITIAITIDKK